MIDLNAIKASLNRDPFVPFTLVTNDGHRFHVKEKNMVFLTQMELYLYGETPEGENIPGSLRHIIALYNVTHLTYDKTAA